jgi:hypothetical protein
MEEEWGKERESEDGVVNGTSLPIQEVPPVSLNSDQEFTSDPALISERSIVSVALLIFVGVCVFIPFTERFDLEFILLMGLIFIFSYQIVLDTFSIYEIHINHSINALVFEGLFLGRRWRVKREILSDSLYLRHHQKVSSSSEGSSIYHEYQIHGKSDKKGDWKLDISRMMRPRYNDHNDKAREIAKSIGIKFESKK